MPTNSIHFIITHKYIFQLRKEQQTRNFQKYTFDNGAIKTLQLFDKCISPCPSSRMKDTDKKNIYLQTANDHKMTKTSELLLPLAESLVFPTATMIGPQHSTSSGKPTHIIAFKDKICFCLGIWMSSRTRFWCNFFAKPHPFSWTSF